MDESNSKNDPTILMRRAKEGDAEAFGSLYQNYFTPIFRYIYFRIKDKETTDDLVQTVFLKVFQSSDRYEEKNKSPLAYFFTVARHTVIDHWKKKKGVKLDEPEKIFSQTADATGNLSELAEKAEISEILHSLIQQLPDEQQEVIVQKFINDLSNREIAQLLGKTEAAVRQLQCRALRKLREHLKDLKII